MQSRGGGERSLNIHLHVLVTIINLKHTRGARKILAKNGFGQALFRQAILISISFDPKMLCCLD